MTSSKDKEEKMTRSKWKSSLLEGLKQRPPEPQPPKVTCSGMEKVLTWFENQDQESECPPLSVSSSVISRTLKGTSKNGTDTSNPSHVAAGAEAISTSASKVGMCENGTNCVIPLLGKEDPTKNAFSVAECEAGLIEKGCSNVVSLPTSSLTPQGKSSVPSSPQLTSPANKIFGLADVTGIKAVKRKDNSATNQVRRKLAYDKPNKVPSIPAQTTKTSQKSGAKRKLAVTPEKQRAVNIAATDQYVRNKKQNILHEFSDVKASEIAMDGVYLGTENVISNTKALDMEFDAAFGEMTILGTKQNETKVKSLTSTNEPCETLSCKKGEMSCPPGNEGGLILSAMDRLSVKENSCQKPAPTPVPRLRANMPNTPTPVPRSRTNIPNTPTPAPRSRLLPVPEPRTKVKAFSTEPSPRTDTLTPPKPKPRSTPSSPKFSENGHHSQLDSNSSEYSKPIYMEENPNDLVALDEDTVMLPVISMEDIDPKFHQIIHDSSFSSPGEAIITLPSPPGSSTPITKHAGMIIFSPTPSASVLPPTPPETPEFPDISSEVEISTNSINEEILAEPLAGAGNLDDNLQDNEVFVTTQRETFRKKQKQPSKQDRAKEAHNKGLEYINTRGKLVSARGMKPACENCRFNCSARLSENQRETIFKNFWALGDKQRRDGFVRECITVKEPAVHKTDDDVKLRTHTIKYSFKFPVIGQVLVCKTMFTNTLGISESPVRTQVQKLERGITVPSPDKRGRHSKIDPAVKEKQDGNIIEHIGLFKTVPSHFCRMRSKRKYLSANLTIRQMWRLYKNWMTKEKPGEEIKSEKYYRKIFCTKFNLGFHKPKKDRCDLCLIYEIGTTAQKKKLQVKFDEHLRNKKNAKEARKKDEQHAKSCSDTVCYCLMDLQQVISLPKTEAGMVFYKRKLSTYNFTVYDRILKKGYCYVWDESEAKRGANEIATCVLLFIKQKVSEGITDFFIWSDNCGGQNKNKYLFAAYTWAAAQYSITITHRYMERGHTMNEADSMHATIERAARYQQIFEPKDLVPIILNAKRAGSKYDVHLVGGEILDLHPLADNLQNWTNKNAKWKTLREITVDGESPGKVFVKHDFTAASSVEIKITKVGRQVNLETYSIPKAYDGPLLLKAKKLADLATLCNELVIPSHKHAFYQGLRNFPAFENPLIDSGNEEELSEDEEARQIAEREFLFDLENDEEEANESDYTEEVNIAKKNRYSSKKNEGNTDVDGNNSDADDPDTELDKNSDKNSSVDLFSEESDS